MPLYAYQAINDTGASVTGTMEADSVQTVHNTLVSRGLIPARVSLQKGLQSGSMRSLVNRLLPIKTPELILFTKQFRTMIKAGVPMMTLLQTLESQTDNPRLRQIIINMTQDITEGSSLYDAFRKHPRVFTP
ncbi:MAG: type II secretion system F family protein, partial [Desulfosarcinaceae bacterium]